MSSWPINVVTLTQAAAGSVLFRRGGEAALRATIIVKASFRMLHDKPAELAPVRDLVRADQPSPSGASLALASELAPYLPGAGVILTGHAHAPEGKPTQAMSVRLAIYRGRALIDKTIHVIGPRQAPGAQPWSFQKMPLVLERAYGGPSFEDNPVGTGASPGSPLPNLVDPRSPARAACFAPIAKTWAPRRRLFGAIDPAILDRAPDAIVELPNGFDFRAFHAAPVDQQMESLRGDEWIILDGLHPTIPRVQARLPEPRAVARIYMVGSSDGNDVRLYADTLVIDTDTLVCSVIWRGHLMLDHPAAIAHAIVYAGVELPGAPVRWPEARDLTATSSVIVRPAGVSQTSIEDMSTEDATLIQMIPRDRPGVTLVPDDEDKLASTGRIDRRRLEKPATPFREPAPGERIEASVADPSPKPRSIALGSTAPTTTLSPFAVRPLPFKNTGEEAAPKAHAHAAIAPFHGVGSGPASGPSAPTPPEDMPLATEAIDLRKLAARRAAIAPFAIAEAGSTIDPPRADLPGAPWSTTPAAPQPPPVAEVTIAPPPPLAEVVIAPPPPLIAPPERVDAPPIEAPPPPVEASPPPLIAPPIEPRAEAPHEDVTPRDRALALLASGASLDGADLAGADLRGVDLRARSLIKTNLRGADLRGALLAGATLQEAVLAEADLTEVVLDKADLAGADLSAIKGERSSWERAMLLGARAPKAKLAGANFQRATLRGADLAGASFAEGKLQRVDAEGATLDDADLADADLRKAKLTSASLRRASLARAQLDKADADRACFEGADLSGASLRSASLQGAALTSASLDGASLDGADLRDAKRDPNTG